ncbi:MAG: AraC family transcriptional regulator [Bacteroidota bacterium]
MPRIRETDKNLRKTQMKVRLSHKDIDELILERYYPDLFASEDETGLSERYYPGHILGARGGYKEIYMENILIGYGNLQLDRGMEIFFETEMETVEMHFALSGDIITRELNTNMEVDFGKNQHNILYASNFRGRSQFPAKQNLIAFEVNLLPGYFKHFLPKQESFIHQFLRSLDRKESSILSPYNYPITPEMHHLILEIIHCNRKGIFKRIFLEAKVTELLLLQLEQMMEMGMGKPKISSLKNQEVERMHAVKNYLLQHLAHPCTLLELAQKFGTNEYALKVGFKEVFGSTVFNFWNAAKMNQAKKMLIEGGFTVGEVADQVGYKNPQHFSTAFKKRFGYSPSKLR